LQGRPLEDFEEELKEPPILTGAVFHKMRYSQEVNVNDPQAVLVRRFRLRKEVTAYVYNILEAQEGITTYSTLPHQPGEAHRDLELSIPIAFISEVNALIEQLKQELNHETGDAIYELKSS
jgi:hypothetical protein